MIQRKNTEVIQNKWDKLNLKNNKNQDPKWQPK